MFVIFMPPKLTLALCSSSASVVILYRTMFKGVGESKQLCLTPSAVLNQLIGNVSNIGQGLSMHYGCFYFLYRP